jgi:hypothetical protein
MLLISHRGNINGRIPEKENDPDYILDAINQGYKVEIDVWYINKEYWLGHDAPQYKINYNWLEKYYKNLYIHCKNLDTVVKFNNPPNFRNFNYFWHETDTITLTSYSEIWAYPGNQPIKNSIAVLPELYNDDLSQCKGICSDNIKKYKK